MDHFVVGLVIPCTVNSVSKELSYKITKQNKQLNEQQTPPPPPQKRRKQKQKQKQKKKKNKNKTKKEKQKQNKKTKRKTHTHAARNGIRLWPKTYL